MESALSPEDPNIDGESLLQVLKFLNASNQFLRLAFQTVKKHKKQRRVKDFSRRRANVNMESITEILTERDFQRSFRMDRNCFQMLLSLVGSDLQRDEGMGQRSKRPAVIPELRLALFLRMMAGASVHDVMTTLRVSRSTAFRIFHQTKAVINNSLSLPGLPSDLEGYRTKSDAFQTSRSPPSPLPGCVGALDGISIKIRKPCESAGPAQYYCRKGFYSIPVQALCDSDYSFMCYSAMCVGSTHDALAHSVSALGQYLDDGNVPDRFWIAGDEAYQCTDSLITPVPGSQANDNEDAFNFYHSSLRMHIEQAFGMLVTKWAILRNIEFSVEDSIEIIGAAIKLHNFCIANAASKESDSVIFSEEQKKMLRDSAGWYDDNEDNEASVNSPEGTRDRLIEIIKDGGYSRPPVRASVLPDRHNNPDHRCHQ